MSAPSRFHLSLPTIGSVPATVRGRVLAIGNFDGIHRGHQALIAAAGETARRLGTEPGILTFEPHPRTVLRPDLPTFRVSDAPSRARLAGIAGARYVVELDFDRELAALAPEEFVRLVLIEALGVRAILVGEGFRFGKGRAGDVAMLQALGAAHGFEVQAIGPVLDAAGAIYASGRVRSALEAGDIGGANEVLGYRWFTTGTVVHGDKRGRELGYPTANIRVGEGNRLRLGIYAVTATVPGYKPLAAVASFGVRPTFEDGGARLLEVHVFDYEGDLYGIDLTVTFMDWIRPEERFTSIEALVTQIDLDAAQARAILATAGPGSAIDRALRAEVAAESAIA